MVRSVTDLEEWVQEDYYNTLITYYKTNYEIVQSVTAPENIQLYFKLV